VSAIVCAAAKLIGGAEADLVKTLLQAIDVAPLQARTAASRNFMLQLRKQSRSMIAVV
jgi:hypothetical protein